MQILHFNWSDESGDSGKSDDFGESLDFLRVKFLSYYTHKAAENYVPVKSELIEIQGDCHIAHKKPILI